MELHDSKLSEAFILKNEIYNLMVTLELRTRHLSKEEVGQVFDHILSRTFEEHEVTFVEACKTYYLEAMKEL